MDKYLKENVAYQMARTILGAYRESCPLRLAQNSLMYRSDMVSLKNRSVLAAYAGGFEDAERESEYRVEYPVGEDVGPKVKRNQLRVLSCKQIPIPDKSGTLAISDTYKEKISTSFPLRDISQMPENVRKSMECLTKPCRIESQNVARGPLIGNEVIALPEKQAFDINTLQEPEILELLKQANIPVDESDNLETMLEKLRKLVSPSSSSTNMKSNTKSRSKSKMVV